MSALLPYDTNFVTALFTRQLHAAYATARRNPSQRSRLVIATFLCLIVFRKFPLQVPWIQVAALKARTRYRHTENRP